MSYIKNLIFLSSNVTRNARIFMFVLASLCSMLCFGQNNPYKINDKLYDYYMICKREIDNPKRLSMTDTLFERARKLGDVKALCLAHILKVELFYNISDTELLKKAVEDAKRFCAKTPYEQYFYYAWGRIIYHYSNNREYKKSFDEIYEMYAYACMHHSEYGKSYIDNILAYYWIKNSSSTTAIALSKKNLTKLKDDNLRFSSLQTLIPNLIAIEQYDEAEQMCNEIEKCKFSTNRKYFITCVRTIIACCKKDEKNVERYFSEFKKSQKLATNSRTNIVRAELTDLYYYTYHKQFHKIFNSLDSLKKYDSSIKTLALTKAYEAEGNYAEALNLLKGFHEDLNLNRDKQAITQSIDFAASIEHTNLKTETGRLKVNAAIAHLAETERISKLQAIESEKKQLSINANNLQAQSQRLTLEKNKLDMRTRQAQINARKKEIEREELIETNLWIVASVLIAFATFSIVMLLRERRLKKSIAIEAYKAQSADRMKTAFVEDISKDMATPLSCIIEGSEKLSSKRNIESNEKEEIAKDIQSNSDYLTDLVNKILASAVKQ